MAVLRGAIKGVWRAAILLFVALLVPSIALLVTSYSYEPLGMDFTMLFLLVLGLEALLGVAALSGIASEVQRSHGEAIDQPAQPAQAAEVPRARY